MAHNISIYIRKLDAFTLIEFSTMQIRREKGERQGGHKNYSKKARKVRGRGENCHTDDICVVFLFSPSQKNSCNPRPIIHKQMKADMFCKISATNINVSAMSIERRQHKHKKIIMYKVYNIRGSIPQLECALI